MRRARRVVSRKKNSCLSDSLYTTRPLQTGRKKIQKNTYPHTHLSCGSWFPFCWAIISNLCNSFDGLWGCCKSCACWRSGLLSAGLTVVSKRLERKVTKHENIYTLAVAKQNSVAELVSTARTDKRISDSEFTIILREVQKCHELKAATRTGETKIQTENKEAQPPDLDKIKGELRQEIKQEFKK